MTQLLDRTEDHERTVSDMLGGLMSADATYNNLHWLYLDYCVPMSVFKFFFNHQDHPEELDQSRV